jgi:hypothetical protein
MLITTYWGIGRDILGRQGREGWGTKVIDRLSADLRERFPDARGYSPRSLKYMRAFAAAWPEEAIVQRSAAQLPWRQQTALIEKLNLSMCSMRPASRSRSRRISAVPRKSNR